MPVAPNRRWIAPAAAILMGICSHAGVAQADSNALWEIVHGQCVPDEQQHGDPKPCAEVDLQSGIAVLKDIRGATQFLLIPTEQITGIESPLILTPRATNYFAEAWQARGHVEKALGHALPRDMLSLAINSQLARSQNQLHIHIDCIRADVRDALWGERSRIGRRWRPLKVLLAGHRYTAMRVTGNSLASHNPFKLLASGIPGAAKDMGRHTLVVVAMRFAHDVPGFVILENQADPAHGDNAGGEELQDHACALGH
jgi:CDP-diacylglycerol pyrophosphatase